MAGAYIPIHIHVRRSADTDAGRSVVFQVWDITGEGSPDRVYTDCLLFRLRRRFRLIRHRTIHFSGAVQNTVRRIVQLKY